MVNLGSSRDSAYTTSVKSLPRRNGTPGRARKRSQRRGPEPPQRPWFPVFAWSALNGIVAHLNQIEYSQFTFGAIYNEHKVECGIVPVHDPPTLVRVVLRTEERLEFRCVQKVAQASWTDRDEGKYLLKNCLRGLVKWRVELGQPWDTRSVD